MVSAIKPAPVGDYEMTAIVLERLGLTCGLPLGKSYGAIAIQARAWKTRARDLYLYAPNSRQAALQTTLALFENREQTAQVLSEFTSAEQELHQVICDLARWQAVKYGACGYAHRLAFTLGVVEEIGEKATALITQNRAGMEDAKGDIAVFLAQLLFHEGLSLAPLLAQCYEGPALALGPETPTAPYEIQITRAAGALAHVVLKHHQQIRGLQYPAVYQPVLCAAAHAILQTCGIEPHHLQTTAKHVMQRNRSADLGGDGSCISEGV